MNEKKPIKKGCLIAILIPIIIVMIFLWSVMSDDSYLLENQTPELTEQIEAVERFSNISVKKLKKIMGKPEGKEDWNDNKYVLTYNVKSHLYEFVIADKKVVQLNIYFYFFKKDKNKKQKYLKLDCDISETYKAFGITSINDNAEYNNNLESTYIINNVNDKIDRFNIQSSEENNDEYYLAKITYDEKYFK